MCYFSGKTPGGPEIWTCCLNRHVFCCSSTLESSCENSVSASRVPMSWGKCSAVSGSQPSPFPLLSNSGTESSSFLNAGERGSSFCPHRSLCRQKRGWAAGFLPALCPLILPSTPPGPCFRNQRAASSHKFLPFLPGSPPGSQPLTRQELWCWRRLLTVPWTAGRSNQSILKEISAEYSLEGLMLKLKLQYTLAT